MKNLINRDIVTASQRLGYLIKVKRQARKLTEKEQEIRKGRRLLERVVSATEQTKARWN